MFGDWKMDDFEGMTNEMLKETLSWCFKYTKILEPKDKISSKEELIHFASRNGFTSLVEKLLKEGMPVDSRGELQFTPLHLASSRGHEDVAKLLLRNGAEVNALGKEKSTPLHLASEEGNVAVGKILIENGANVNSVDDVFKATPLDYAAKYGSIPLMKLLLEKGSDVNSFEDCSVLHIATIHRNIEVIEFLLQNGAIIDSEDEGGRIPLYLAIDSG